MCEANQTYVTQIHLLGFQGLYKFKALFFIMFLLSYITILSGNLLIIVLVTTINHLKVPMFFFLKHLATADILLTTTIIPMMLDITFSEEGTLPFIGCFLQLYCFGIIGSVQSFLIASMSYDRYLAICTPLHYATRMNPNVSLQLFITSWFVGALLISSDMIMLFQFKFCGLNYVDHFFCDFGPIVALSTSDTSSLEVQDFFVSMFTIFLPFAFIVVTYFCISFTILKISSAFGRRKAFSTCSSHLATVCIYFMSLVTVYMLPADYSTININKYRSLLYIVVTPLMNPIIYSLRNQEMKKALRKLISNLRTVN